MLLVLGGKIHIHCVEIPRLPCVFLRVCFRRSILDVGCRDTYCFLVSFDLVNLSYRSSSPLHHEGLFSGLAKAVIATAEHPLLCKVTVEGTCD